jgi:hypothetical protein
MAFSAQSLILRVITTLQDATAVRWATDELVRYLNDGQREILVYRPDATATTASVALAAGAKQSLPAGSFKLIDIVRNTNGTKRAIRLTTRALLDSQVPSWQYVSGVGTDVGVTEIKHYVYDSRDPKVFYVYPPAASSGASVEMVYSALPTDITEPAPGALYTAITGNLSVSDLYTNALTNYVLHRAYAKDAEFAANGQIAATYYASFQNALTAELSGTAGVAPKE